MSQRYQRVVYAVFFLQAYAPGSGLIPSTPYGKEPDT